MAKTKNRQRRERLLVSLRLQWLRVSFRLQAMISTAWASKRLYELWFASPKFPEPRREAGWRQQARELAIPHEDGPLATYIWGEGDKSVLLLHGWSGRGTQLGAFVEPLLARGYRVVGFDMPGHGRTPGKDSNIFRMTAALQAVTEQTGPFTAAIAHSFGCMVLTYALTHTDFKTEKAVCISSPTNPLYLVDSFCHALHINERLKQHFKQRFEKRFSGDVWQHISAAENARKITIPALIIHDRDDRDVPVRLGERLADAWPNSELLITEGLGHRLILRNRGIVQKVTDFICD